MNNENYIKNLCDNITLLRKKRGLSREEIAQVLHADACMVEKIEDGILPPELTCDSLIRISQRFGIELYKLFLYLE